MTNLRAIKDESPVDCVVSALEEMLGRARRGEIRGIVMAFDAKGTMGHHLAIGKDSIPMALVGEMDLAKFTVLVETGRIRPPR